MKKILILTSLLFVITLFAHGSDAFYQSYWSDDRNFEVTIPEVFFGSEKGVVTMIVQPEFKGTADSFAFVMVVPNTPTEVTVEPLLLESIQEKTIPSTPKVNNVTVNYTNSEGESVEVIPTAKYHDDYEISFFPSSSIDSFVSWLEKKGYTYQEEDIRALRQYEPFGQSTLVVIDVNVSETARHDDEGFFGTLSPLSLSYTSSTPYLALPVSHSVIEFDTYVLSPNYFYIPGVAISYSNMIEGENNTLLSSNNPWLIKQQVLFDPLVGSRDLYFHLDSEGYTVQPQSGSTYTLHPEYHRVDSGIQTAVLTQESDNFTTLREGTRLLKYGVQGEDVKELQLFLNQNLTLELVADGKWGSNTHNAVEQFQSRHELSIDGIIGPQTRSYISQIIIGE